MKFQLCLIFFIFLTSTCYSGVCEKKYPPIKTMVKKPVKVAYTAIVKVPYKATKRCLKKGLREIKKKPWKVITKPFTYWADCAYTAYKDVKEKKYREEFKEIEEIKDAPEFIKCAVKEKEFGSALKAFLLLSNPLGASGVASSFLLDNLRFNEKKVISTISEDNLSEVKETFTIMANGRALTYQTLFKGTISMNLEESVNDKELAIHDRTDCSHEVKQIIEWTKPCLVDNRPLHQYLNNEKYSFSCAKKFEYSQKLSRGKELGKGGDGLRDNDDCGNLYSYILSKLTQEKLKLQKITNDQISILSNTQYLKLSKILNEVKND